MMRNNQHIIAAPSHAHPEIIEGGSYGHFDHNQSPAEEQMRALQGLYDFFNKELFDGELPEVMLSHSRSHLRNAAGFFIPGMWVRINGEKEIISEISINPATMLILGPQNICSTLVHEQVHLWQILFGAKLPHRPGYHNKEFAAKMIEIGLMPSSTGEPGGARTGYRMSDYPIPGGPFLDAYGKMSDIGFIPFICLESLLLFSGDDSDVGFDVSVDVEEIKTPVPQTSKRKLKYTCLGCKINVWGKPNLNVGCLDCKTQMMPMK